MGHARKEEGEKDKRGPSTTLGMTAEEERAGGFATDRFGLWCGRAERPLHLNFFLWVRRLGVGPEDVEVFFDGGEVLVACRSGGFAVGGQGGGAGGPDPTNWWLRALGSWRESH
jgi:hypothetical protein